VEIRMRRGRSEGARERTRGGVEDREEQLKRIRLEHVTGI